MDNALSDFLADAMHLCNLGLLKDCAGNTAVFDIELERGRGHYDAEMTEDADYECLSCGEAFCEPLQECSNCGEPVCKMCLEAGRHKDVLG